MKIDTKNRRVNKVSDLIRNTSEGSKRVARITFYDENDLIRIETSDEFVINTLNKNKKYNGYKRVGRVIDFCGLWKVFYYQKI